MIYEDGKLFLYGEVGDAPGEHFTLRMVREALAKHGDSPLTVYINSGGGFLSEGLGIHNALKSHAGRVTTVVDGIAASSASLIAMAGAEIVMRRGSTMMIHDPSFSTSGTAADHEKSGRALTAMADGMAAIYAARSGLAIEAVRVLMVAETWMTDEQAVAAGFATRVEDVGARAAASHDYASDYAKTPKAVARSAARSGWAKALSNAMAQREASGGFGLDNGVAYR